MRRLASTVVVLGLLLSLLVTIGHSHFDSVGQNHTACVFCAGAAVAAPEPPALLPPTLVAVVASPAEPSAPPAQYALPLAHSGCAPPRA